MDRGLDLQHQVLDVFDILIANARALLFQKAVNVVSEDLRLLQPSSQVLELKVAPNNRVNVLFVLLFIKHAFEVQEVNFLVAVSTLHLFLV